MHLYIIDELKTSKITKQIAQFTQEYKENSIEKHALVVSGDSLIRITSQEKLCNHFISLAEKCDVVIAGRVSPKQKAEVISIIKKRHPQKTTLAIGDGANDVNMITTANVGIGICGLEGQQAARVSDFALGQFKHLRPLLLVHGRESYRKISYTVCYMFYKNVIGVMTVFWFGLLSNFSGQTIFDPWLYQFYGLMFTSTAIISFGVLDYEYPK